MPSNAFTIDRRNPTTPREFSDKTNPFRPGTVPDAGCREMRGEERPFDERCEPRHSNRPLTEEQQQLVTRYMPMARALARKAAGTSPDFEEYEAEAYAALVEAGRRFDPAFGVGFAAFARPRIAGALRDYRRFLAHTSRRAHAEDSPVFLRLERDDYEQGRMLGAEPDPPVGHDIEASEAVAWIFRHLPRAQAVACRLLYFEEKSYEDTAEVLDCSRGYLWRSHRQALARLRDNFADVLAG